MHNEPSVFPDPLKFNPERWLQKDTRELENHFVPFSRGPRMCLGFKYVSRLASGVQTADLRRSLAWCELYLIFANIFRKLDLEVYETTSVTYVYP
jgi:hypothetical protein